MFEREKGKRSDLLFKVLAFDSQHTGRIRCWQCFLVSSLSYFRRLSPLEAAFGQVHCAERENAENGETTDQGQYRAVIRLPDQQTKQ